VKKKLKEVQESNLVYDGLHIPFYIYNIYIYTVLNIKFPLNKHDCVTTSLHCDLGAKGTNSWEWEKLYDQFTACGGDWLKSELVLEAKDSKETSKFGRWKTMSKLVTHLKPRGSMYGIFIYTDS